MNDITMSTEEIEYVNINIENEEHDKKVSKFLNQVSELIKVLMEEYKNIEVCKVEYSLYELNWLRAEIHLNKKKFRKHWILFDVKKCRESIIYGFLDSKASLLSQRRSFEDLLTNIKARYSFYKEEM